MPTGEPHKEEMNISGQQRKEHITPRQKRRCTNIPIPDLHFYIYIQLYLYMHFSAIVIH